MIGSISSCLTRDKATLATRIINNQVRSLRSHFLEVLAQMYSNRTEQNFKDNRDGLSNSARNASSGSKSSVAAASCLSFSSI